MWTQVPGSHWFPEAVLGQRLQYREQKGGDRMVDWPGTGRKGDERGTGEVRTVGRQRTGWVDPWALPFDQQSEACSQHGPRPFIKAIGEAGVRKRQDPSRLGSSASWATEATEM